MNAENLEDYRLYLLRYATLQLRDPQLAADVVQETLLAALDGASFAGRSSRKTWLTGILKHKIIDVLRRQAREQPLSNSKDIPEAEAVDALFADDGHWREFPKDWGSPEKSFEDKQFREMFEMCASVMPLRLARAFMMREVMELSSAEICTELAITQSNLWVILHRARLLLRECLEIRWFGKRA